MTTAADLAARYNELTGKALKANSYSKAKWIEMIELLPIPVDDVAPVDDETTFTMSEIAASLKINPKLARARYRRYDNDGERTRYEFLRSDWDRVAKIIS